MADTITSSTNLKLEYEFYDGDTRATTLPNPKSNLTASEINVAAATLLETQAFIGDKTGAAFTKIQSAQRIETTRRKVDLS